MRRGRVPYTDLSWAQFDALNRVGSDFAEPPLVVRANTLYALEERGLIEAEPGPRAWVTAAQLSWRRTEKGQSLINRTAGAKAP
jgi:hypothetical protein